MLCDDEIAYFNEMLNLKQWKKLIKNVIFYLKDAYIKIFFILNFILRYILHTEKF